MYGCQLKVCIVGYLREERNFNTLDDLIQCIRQDITQAKQLLEESDVHKDLQNHPFFLLREDDDYKDEPENNGKLTTTEG